MSAAPDRVAGPTEGRAECVPADLEDAAVLPLHWLSQDLVMARSEGLPGAAVFMGHARAPLDIGEEKGCGAAAKTGCHGDPQMTGIRPEVGAGMTWIGPTTPMRPRTPTHRM